MSGKETGFAFPEGPIPPEWVYTVGAGALEQEGPVLRFLLVDATAARYSDAQIDDYRGRPRRRFPWRPPVRMAVRARFSHPAGVLRGTAGFGFWNDPFLMTGARLPALPQAVWFFYASPPSEMKLDLETPGWGWKAATIDAGNPSALRWALLAPILVPLMNLRALYQQFWPPVQRALQVREAAIGADMTQWHTCVLEWGEREVRFEVDGEPVLEGAPSPRGPLGFVMWMDNQYMVATPWGRLGWGLLDVPGRQWMEVDHISLKFTGDSRPLHNFFIPSGYTGGANRQKVNCLP